jgi:hypothetical protein
MLLNIEAGVHELEIVADDGVYGGMATNFTAQCLIYRYAPHRTAMRK